MGVKDWTAQQCYDRALTLIEAEKFDKARKLLQLGRLKDPTHAQIAQAMGIVDDLMAKAAEAEESSGEMTEDQLNAAFEDVQKHIAAGELDDAAKMIQVVLSMYPEKRFRELQGQVNERKAAQASGVDFEAQVRLREVLKDRDYRVAEQMVREQLRDNRSNPVLQWQLAVVLYTGLESPEQASGPIQEALRLDPDRTEILALAEDIERALGHQEAADALKLRLEKATDHNNSEVELARMKAKEFANRTEISEHRPIIQIAVDVQERERRRLRGLIAIVGLLTVMTGWYYYTQQPTELDLSAYDAVIPILSATETAKNDLGLDRDEIELRTEASTWQGLGEGACETVEGEEGTSLKNADACVVAREDVLSGLSSIAAGFGYRLVVLKDASGVVLGSCRISEETGGQLIFLP
jgi:tetratricopeptide (TPR) repeat protein